ncbi:MAG: S41 family peptidase [Candidatus Omnitrophica bacterium]|nr:S41 family peptidase [Candidatus Omnitrophota bacterium]
MRLLRSRGPRGKEKGTLHFGTHLRTGAFLRAARANKSVPFWSVPLFLLFLSSFLFAPRASQALKAAQEAIYDQVEILAEAITIIQNEYVDPVAPKELIYGALRGLVGSLDPHSQFLDPDAFTEMQVDTKGEFGGVGLEISVSKDGNLTVVAPIDDTPAAKAGLKPNDKVTKIEGQAIRDVSLHEAVKRLRGRPGTRVTLTILRESENRLFDVTLTRSIIQIHSVRQARWAAPGIAYVRITEFQDNTPADLRRALQELRVSGFEGLILDLRNNPGGLLDVAVEVAELFLEKGKPIVSTKGRVKGQNLEFISRSESPLIAFPMVILVNGGSASASEIVAGALKDHHRAILMGTRTFGKGSVQTVIPLKDGSAIRLTTAKYYTPSGVIIHGKGLEPDVVVEEKAPPESRSGAKPEEDSLVLRAVDLLKGLKVLKGKS